MLAGNIVDFQIERILNESQRIDTNSDMFEVQRLKQLHLYKKYPVNVTPKIGSVSVIYASEWLTEDSIVFRTNCNKVKLYDTKRRSMTSVKLLGERDEEESLYFNQDQKIAVNPSRTLLATRGLNPNDISIHKLPNMEPVCRGTLQTWDKNVIFTSWMDDITLGTVTSKHDTLAVWRVQEQDSPDYDNQHFPSMPYEKVVLDSEFVVKDVVFNKKARRLCLAGKDLKILDCETAQQIPKPQGPVYVGRERTICINKDCSVLAVGCEFFIVLADPDDTSIIASFKYHTWTPGERESIQLRSLNFLDNVLTIGLSNGKLKFFDVRALKFLEVAPREGEPLHQPGQELTLDNAAPEQNDPEERKPHGVRTHSFSPGLKLFCGGSNNKVGATAVGDKAWTACIWK